MTAARHIAVTHVSPFGDYEGRIVFSGAENHLFQLMAGQREAGLDVELLMLVVRDGPRLNAKSNELRASGIKVTRLVYDRHMTPLIGRAAWLVQLPRLIRLLRDRRERIIHTHQPHASQLGRLAAKIAGCRVVVDTVHNDEPHFARFDWRLRLRTLDRFTRSTIAISRRVKSHLVENVGLDATTITVIPYGIKTAQSADRRRARAELNLPDDQFVVGFVGRMVPQKDLGVLLQALKFVDGAHLCLVGAGEEEAALRDEARRLDLTNVSFAGARPNGAELMAAFDVFALPSKWEGLGLVLLEAMSQGVPIVATRGGAIPEVLDDGRLGLLSNVGDAQGLAANIERLRRCPALRERLVSAGREAISQRYSVAAMVKATSAVYESVCCR